MALVKYGAIVVEIKGKVGGTVFQSHTAGFVAGNMAKMSRASVRFGKQVQNSANKVIPQHSNLSATASAWKSLTEGDRAAWGSAAVNFPFQNKYGEWYTGSGYQLYMSLNINNRTIGTTPVDTPPSPPTIVATPAFTITDNLPVDKFLFNMTGDAAYKYVIYSTSPISAGIGYQKSKMKAITIWLTGTSTPTLLDGFYLNVFGPPPPSGTVWFEVRAIHIASGVQAPPYIVKYTW